MKTYIWTIPTRIFHWLLAVSFVAAYILGEEENYLSLHAAFGTFIGGLIVFRIIQGFTGPKYARFRDFPVSPAALAGFIKNMKQSKSAHAGHNPPASLVMLAIMLVALVSALSGMLILATGETGMFGLHFTPGFDPEIFGEIHEIAVNLFLVLVGFHMAGILADTIFHPGNGTIFSIFTGYKRIKAADTTPSFYQTMFPVLWFAIPLLMFFYVLGYQQVPAGENENTEQVNENEETED